MAGLSNLLSDPGAPPPDPRDIPLTNPLAGFDPAQGQDAGQLPGLPPSFPNLGFSPPKGTFDETDQWQPRTDVPFDFSQTNQEANQQAGPTAAAVANAVKAGLGFVPGLGQITASIGASMIDPWMLQGLPTAFASPFPDAFFSQRTEYFHQTPGEFGNDYAMPVGTPIRAPWDGIIRWEQAGKQNWGNRIFVSGGNGWTFAVGHLTRFAVGNGTRVQAGQIIGFSGGATSDPNSGNSTGPHIEPQLINPRGQYVDPLPWLQRIYAGSGPVPGAKGYNLAPPTAGVEVGGAKPAAAVIYGPGSPNYRSQYENLIPHNLGGGHAGAGQPGSMAPSFSDTTLHPQQAAQQQGGGPLGWLGDRVMDIVKTLPAVTQALPHPYQGSGPPVPVPQTPPGAPGEQWPFNPQGSLRIHGLEGQGGEAPQWLKDIMGSGAVVSTELRTKKDKDGKPVLDAQGNPVPELDAQGKPIYDIGPPNPAMSALFPVSFATALAAKVLSHGDDQLFQQLMEGAGKIPPYLGPEFSGLSGLAALRQARTAFGMATGKAAEPSLPGMGPTLGERLNIAKPSEILLGKPAPAEAPTTPVIPAAGAQMTLGGQQAPEGVPPPTLQEAAAQAKQATPEPGVPANLQQKVQEVQALANQLHLGDWGGQTNRAAQLVGELATTAPEQIADVARNRIQALDDEAARLQRAQPDAMLSLNQAGDPAAYKETLALANRLAHVDLTRGVYVSALKRIVGGYNHELGPTFRSISNTLRNPYALRSGVVNFPTDGNLAVSYNGKMRNVLDALGQKAANWMEKTFPDNRVREQVWQVMENPDAVQGFDPRVVELGKALRLLLDETGIYLADERGMFDALRKDYFPRIIIGWRDPANPNARLVKGKELRAMIASNKASPLNTDSPRFHSRSIQDGLQELEARGWVVQKDPAQVLPLYFRSIARAVGNDNILNFIKTSYIRRDGRPAFREGVFAKGPPEGAEGYKHLTVEGDHPAAPKLSGWIHPDIVNQLNYQMTTQKNELFGSERAFKAAQYGGEIFREAVMVNPLFHGLNQLSHQLMHTLIPPRLWVAGHVALKDPEFMREVATYTAYRPHRLSTDMNQAADNIAAGVPRWRFGQDWAGIPSPLKYAVDKAHTALFDVIIGNAQAIMYREARDRFLKVGMDPEQARLAAGAYADRIVGMQDPMTKTHFERSIAPMIFFAPNWTKTHLFQPVESLPFVGRKVLQYEHRGLTKETADMLSSTIGYGTARGIMSAIAYAQLLNYWTSGHSTFENENGRPLDWDITQFAHDHLGYRGRQRLYIEMPVMRFNNWYISGGRAISQHGGVSPGGLVMGGTQFIESKLMPPFSSIMQMLSDTGSPTDNTRALRLLESFFPYARQLQAMTGDTVIGPHSIETLLGAINDIQQGHVTESPDAQRLINALAAFVIGENPPKHGPAVAAGPGAPTTASITQAWMVGMELASQGLSPVNANEEQKAAARAAVENQADPEGYYDAQNKRMEDVQAKALQAMGADAGVDLSLAKQAEYRSEGLNPMDLLDAVRKQQIFTAHPELELWHQVPSRDPDEKVRAVQSDNAAYHVQLSTIQDAATAAQQRDDLAASQGIISPQTWRDLRIRRLNGLYNADTGTVTALLKAYPNAIIDRASYDKFLAAHGKPPRGVTRFDAAYQEYTNINLDDPKYQLADGSPDVLQWKTDRDGALRGLSQDEQDYIKNRESAHWTNTGPINEFLYHQVTNEYLSFEQQHADAVRLYHQMYQTTDTPLARKFFEAQHPELFTYIVQRALWFREHPLAATFFEHGYGLQKTLLTSGQDPFASPAEQIASLLRNPRPTEPLDLSGIQQSAAGTGQPAVQSAPQQPGSYAATLYQNPP